MRRTSTQTSSGLFLTEIHVGPLEIARLPRQELHSESQLPIADLAAWSRAPISDFLSPRYAMTQLSVASGSYLIGSFLK